MMFSVTMNKQSKKVLSKDKVQEQLGYVIERIEGGGRKEKGWDANASFSKKTISDGLDYQALFKVKNNNPDRKPELLTRDKDQIVKVMAEAGKPRSWFLTLVDGQKPALADNVLGKREIVYAQVELPDNWRDCFSHIYERDDQIELVGAAIEAFVLSDFTNRFHTVLFGDPGTAKTEICRSFKKILGDKSVLEFSASETTSAGAIRMITEMDEVPPILLVEEIEKADENSLRWLLGALDDRAEIRKVVFRGGILQEYRCLCLATVNNKDLFDKLMSQALSSRFCNPIYCPRPSRTVMEKFLEREINKVKDGKLKWITPALDYAAKKKINDPRIVKSICLCGRDDLLSGRYQQRLENCSQVEKVK